MGPPAVLSGVLFRGLVFSWTPRPRGALPNIRGGGGGSCECRGGALRCGVGAGAGTAAEFHTVGYGARVSVFLLGWFTWCSSGWGGGTGLWGVGVAGGLVFCLVRGWRLGRVPVFPGGRCDCKVLPRVSRGSRLGGFGGPGGLGPRFRVAMAGGGV